MSRALVAVCLAAGLAAPAAAFEVVVESASLSSRPGDQDFAIEVFVRVGEGEVLPDVGGWQVAVALEPAAAGVEILAPFALPAAPPPLVDENFLPDFDASSGPARATATAFLDSGGVPPVDGAGLFRIPIRVAGLTEGDFALRIDLSPFTGTLVVDDQAVPIPFTPVDGLLEIAPAPEVPGLSAGALVVLVGMLAGAGAAGLRRSRSG